IYQVTILNSALPAGYTWDVPFLHNSPAKPTTCPAGTTNQPILSVTGKKVDKKQVQVTIKNAGNADAFLTGLNLTWPQATNGNLVQVKLDGDVIYSGPAIGGGSANLTTAQLIADPNKRKVGKNSSDNLILIFQNTADTNLSHYTGTASFGATNLTILP